MGALGGDLKHWPPCFHLSDEGIATGGLSFIIVNEEQIKAFEGRGQVNDICETCSLGGAFLLGPEHPFTCLSLMTQTLQYHRSLHSARDQWPH